MLANKPHWHLGNEQANKAAKAALIQPISSISLPHTDFKLSINIILNGNSPGIYKHKINFIRYIQ